MCNVWLSPRRERLVRFVKESVIKNKSPLRFVRACTWREKRIDASRRATWTRERCRVYCWGWILTEGKKIRYSVDAVYLFLLGKFPREKYRMNHRRRRIYSHHNYVALNSSASKVPRGKLRCRNLTNISTLICSEDRSQLVCDRISCGISQTTPILMSRKETFKLALYILNDCASHIFTGFTIRSIFFLSPFCSFFTISFA